MFKANRPKPLKARVADFFWPSNGFRRAWQFRMKRLSRMQVSEHRISLGFAAGAFASFTPLIGFHFLLAAALALALRGNLVASAVGTVVGNPLTFPLIWLSTYQLGIKLTGSESAASDPFSSGLFSAADLSTSVGTVLLPMLVGGIPLGLACALACYWLVFTSLRKIRKMRKASRSTAQQGSAG